MSKSLFMQKLASIFGDKDVKMPSESQVEREKAEARRAENLLRIKPAITVEDVNAIVHDTLDDQPALAAVRQWFEAAQNKRQSRDGRPMRFLVLVGLPSRGKTVAACTVLAEKGGYYVSAPDLHRLANSRAPAARHRIEELHTGICVVLDDLGTEDVDASMESAVWDLINERQTHGKLTVLTANMTRAQFEKRYGERTVRRIEHQGAIIEIQGEDLRRKPL